jgi:transcriptional regulator of arginine metabolism
MRKQERQFAIKEIISTKSIASQGDLSRELRRKGVAVTQATLSRDLRELGVSRVAATGRPRYALEAPSEVQILRPLVGAEVLSIDANESMIVIRTLPACANTVGEFLDGLKSPEIIGTVAGDNTLLVIPRSVRKTQDVLKLLKRKLFEGRE